MMASERYRVCKLEGCSVYRVEAWQRPRWFNFWNARWVPVLLNQTFMLSSVPAEYSTLWEATATMERVKAADLERVNRREGLWRSSW